VTLVTFLRTTEGRLRLGWRLTVFVLGTVTVTLLLGALLPAGLIGGSAALLCGALALGSRLLMIDGLGPGSLGFYASAEAMSETGKGFGLGMTLGLVVVGLMAAMGGLRWTTGGGSPTEWVWSGLSALLLLLLPAAAEEAFLRGYPLQALAEVWGRWKAVAVTAFAFALLHVGNPGAGVLTTANVMMAGVLLGVVYIKTLSLWWATGVHLGWNWAHGFVADVPVSGLEVMDAPMYEGVPTGSPWIGGGSFGPEGSVVATVVLLAATGACWYGPWLRPGNAARAAGSLSTRHEDWDEH
jgi:membrane protease YdiL (CAAX protease family)